MSKQNKKLRSDHDPYIVEVKKIRKELEREVGTEEYYLQELDYIEKRREAQLKGKTIKDTGRDPKFVFVHTYEPRFEDFNLLNDTEKTIRCRKCGNPVMFIFNGKKICIQCIENKTLKMIFRMFYSLKLQLDRNFESLYYRESAKMINDSIDNWEGIFIEFLEDSDKKMKNLIENALDIFQGKFEKIEERQDRILKLVKSQEERIRRLEG